MQYGILFHSFRDRYVKYGKRNATSYKVRSFVVSTSGVSTIRVQLRSISSSLQLGLGGNKYWIIYFRRSHRTSPPMASTARYGVGK